MNTVIVCGITQDHVINIGTIDPNNGSDRHYLQFEAAQAFLTMQRAAALDGVDCQILSSYRSFAQQQSISLSKQVCGVQKLEVSDEKRTMTLNKLTGI